MRFGGYITKDGNEKRQKKINSDDREIKQSPLESAKSHIARSPGSGLPGDGSSQAFTASFRALLQWAEERGLIFKEGDFPFLFRSPDGSGDEHEAWFDEATNRWFKATYPNRFGLAWGRQDTATPYEYICRLTLQNIYFADKIELVGLINCAGKLRVLTSQPHIAGDPASCDEIKNWFLELGFVQIVSNGGMAW
jgi:hypothetical protein